MQIFLWLIRITIAGILLQTLRYKFGGLPESIYIFSKIGIEPWGRIGSGIIELIASILILHPKTTGIGALIALLTMLGAIILHVTILGTEIGGSKGLFYLAIITFTGSAILVWHFREQITFLNQIFK
jgi:uncharacterized membrane protein YphA (DoxX/SURF4 family)